jgi:hypothetical protein
MSKYYPGTEFAVGEKFTYKETILQVVETKENKCIYPCFFRLAGKCTPLDIPCSVEDRVDHKSVMFVEVGKVGEVEPVHVAAPEIDPDQLEFYLPVKEV